MSPLKRFRLALAGVLLVVGGMAPVPARAAQDNPDFYATIIAIARDRSTITLSPTKDQVIVVDVRELGSAPFDIGDFRLDNVILLRTKRIGDGLVATGWEGARDGSQDTAFEGISPRKEPQKEDKKTIK